MSTAQQNGALASRADWTMAEAIYDVFEPLLFRKPLVAVAMAAEMELIARRYAEQHLPQVAAKLWPDGNAPAGQQEQG